MKRIQTLGIFLLLISLLSAGCSAESLLERGTGLLDDMFAGDSIAPIPSSAEPDPEPDPAAEPSQEPDIPASEEPDIPDPDKPVVPGDPGTLSAADPAGQSVTAQTSAPSDPPSGSSGKITPSHTDVTLFNAGESFSYQPKGTTGTYACTYTSNNEKVASVDDKTGKVTAVGPGTTEVKMHVECNGQYDFSCIVRCSWKDDGKKDDSKKDDGKKNDSKPAVPSGTSSVSSSGKTDEPVLPPATTPAPASSSSSSLVTASHSDATFFNPKEHFTFSAKGAGDDSVITYKSSDSSIASVDSKTGVVTAVGPGKATVTMSVECGGTEYIFDCIVRCSW